MSNLKTSASGYGVYVDLTERSKQGDFYKKSKAELDELLKLGSLDTQFKSLLDTGMLVEDALKAISGDPALADCNGDRLLIESKLSQGLLPEEVYKWNYQLDLVFDLSIKENSTFIKELEKQLQETYEGIEEFSGKKFKPNTEGMNTPLVYFSKCKENSVSKLLDAKFGSADTFARVRFKSKELPAFLIRDKGITASDFQDDYSQAYSGAKYIVKYDLACASKGKTKGGITAYMYTVLLDDRAESWEGGSNYSQDELAFG